ncbi:MAG: DMT family transporter [Rhizobiaceae bacterium]
MKFDRQTSSQNLKQNQVVKGMGLMIVAMLMLPFMDAIAKTLTLNFDVSAGQTTFGRFLVQACLMGAVIVVSHGWRALLPSQLWLNLLRGALMSLAVMIFFATLRYMPIADALAVFFLEPFILTIMSALLLKETVGWRRRIAVVVGFIGALFIIQPSYAVFGAVSLMPICTAFLFACYLTLTRAMASKDSVLTMQFAAGVGGVITLGVTVTLATMIGWDDFSSPSFPEFGIRWGLIFAIGCIATIGHLLVVTAFRMVSASTLAPFQYLEIIPGVVLGYWLFDDLPDFYKWLGIAIIVLSGIYLFFRERTVAKEEGAFD